MSDLTAKFQGLRQDETDSIRQTNSLLAAIKGDGPDSLVDLANAVNLNTATLVDIRTLLESLNTTIELLNNNTSTNAQQTISAVINSSCGCDVVSPESPYPTVPPGNDCDAGTYPLVSHGQTGPTVQYVLPEGVYEFGPPRTINQEDIIFVASETANPDNYIILSLDQCPYNGAVNAGSWDVYIQNSSTNGSFNDPIGWCFTTGDPAPELKCSKAQAVYAGFVATMAAFSRMSDGTVLTNTGISLAYSYASAFIEARPPDSLTRQNLLNLYANTAGGFHYGFLPSDFSGPVKDALIGAIFNATTAESAGIAFLDVLEVQSGLDAPYLDFVKSIPQQFWFNAVFEPGSTVLNTAPFDNEYCSPS